MTEFISLTELGVGCILVRHTEIISMEPTSYCFSRIELSTGTTRIVEESPIEIVNKIKLALKLEKELEVSNTKK